MDKIASLLVPFSGEGKLLRQFFECLKKSHDILKYEIILIGDGCSNHDTIEYAKQLYRHHSVDHLLLFNQSLGFGVANNEGVKRSTTNRLVFINDDIILINHEIDLLLQEQKKNNCAAIQPCFCILKPIPSKALGIFLACNLIAMLNKVGSSRNFA